MSRSRPFTLTVLALVLLLPVYALAQGGTPTGSGGGTPTTGGGTGPTRTTTGSIPSITTAPSTQQQRQPEGPIFLSGQVVLEDGTTPPNGVSVERVCNGQVRREAYTDSKGQFGFQIGQTNAVFQDASIANPNLGAPGVNSGMNMDPLANPRMGENGLLGCELRATLAGYHSDYINLSNHQRLDNPNVGTIVLHKLGKVEGTTISVTTMQAPKEARKALERGNKALKKNNLPEAEVEFRKAVEIDPRFADAWTQLGLVCQKGDRDDEAAKAYNAALSADAKFLRPYFGLIDLAAAANDWKQMAELSEKALALNGYEYPTLYFYNSVANYNLHRFDVAEKSARSARRLDSQHHIPRIDLLLGNILTQRQDYAGAAEELRSFLKFSGASPESETAKVQLQRLEQLSKPGNGTPK